MSSAIESSDVPGDLLDGDPDEFYRVCYRAKCPKETIGDVAVSDRFAGRPFSKWKTSLICAPALRGELYDVTFRLNSPESLLGLQVDVTYDASDIGFEGQGASVSCDTMVTDPDAVALLDDEEAGRLSAMVIEGDTVSGPMDVFTCRVAAMSAPTSSDFTVVAEGVEPDATPTAPSVTISSIVPVE